jgi:predicted unusual protein kinase regulating ubiquinone biosynthesis (AarF/ABC1/UbiB family)
MPQPGGTPPDAPPNRASQARYRRIVRFAARYLAQAWWFELILPRLGLRRFAARGRSARLQNIATHFRALAADLGGLMIKVGQFLSARLDVLPPEFTDELEGLQDEVAAEPFDKIRVQVESELGMPLESAFAYFDPSPVAAASLGQAHRARLTPALAADLGFTDVIVKVQRPGIEEIVDVDLSALRRIGGWVSHVSFVSKRANAPALVEEFATTSLQEIDYLHEARNAERFAENFADDPHIAAPVVVWERSSLRVLTLSDVSAIKISNVEALVHAGIDPDAVAQELARATFQQVFVSGFFHADPHPGNIFVTPIPAAESAEPGTPANWRLTFVDFGMMGEISDSLRSSLQGFILAAVGRDGRALVASLEGAGVLLTSADTDELERAMSALFDRFGGMGIAELQTVDARELEEFGREFSETVRDLPFQLPENFLMLIRAISLVSGVTSTLNRDFNMWDAVEPFARNVLSASGKSAMRDLPRQAIALGTTLARLPGKVDELTTRIDSGQLAIRTPDLDRRLRSIERSLTRLGTAIVFAGLLIAGVLLRPTDDALGWILMAAATVPLLHLVVTLRVR